ncbi:MAG: porin family protein [Bacteroidales bacterium]|nr:porin family protein [Bacteroidales bacterium]
MRKIYIFMLTAVMLPLLASAQSTLGRGELGLSIGGMNYIGDLNNQSVFGRPSLGYGAFYRYKIDPRWSIQVGGSLGSVEGGNPDAITRRNLSFQSDIWEGYARIEFNYQPFGFKGKSNPWTTFLFVGIGMFGFNPTTTYIDDDGQQQTVELRPLGTEGQGTAEYPDREIYSLSQVMMPFGLGVRFKPSDAFYITIEYGFRKTWTDYLDDVSTTYVDPDVLNGLAQDLYDRTGEIDPGYHNPIGSRRGDDSLDDWYAYFNVSASFSTEFLFGWMRRKNCERK